MSLGDKIGRAPRCRTQVTPSDDFAARSRSSWGFLLTVAA